jgi:hypothetical protein
MKRIRVAISGQIPVSTSGTNLTEAMKVADQARTNRLKVIEGALTVEYQLNAVILYYFFGASHEKRDTFESVVLNSDWCSFAAKRKLIRHIINEQELLEGQAKDEFDKLIGKVMSVRNAFAHGRLSSDEKRVWLSYFQGTPQKRELTDEHLTEIETLLQEAVSKALALAVKIGAKKPAETA